MSGTNENVFGEQQLDKAMDYFYSTGDYPHSTMPGYVPPVYVPPVYVPIVPQDARGDCSSSGLSDTGTDTDTDDDVSSLDIAATPSPTYCEQVYSHLPSILSAAFVSFKLGDFTMENAAIVSVAYTVGDMLLPVILANYGMTYFYDNYLYNKL